MRESAWERIQPIADFVQKDPVEGAPPTDRLEVRLAYDDDALRILRVCRAAMGPGARLLIVDAILPERAVDQPAAIRMDLHMLMLLGARERTEAEFGALLARAGFELRRAIPTGSPAGLGVIEAVSSGAA